MDVQEAKELAEIKDNYIAFFAVARNGSMISKHYNDLYHNYWA